MMMLKEHVERRRLSHAADLEHSHRDYVPAAMRSAQALTNFCAMADEQARRLADEGIQLYYHNHHIEFAKRGGVYILDHIREQAPNLRFEIDVHWVQRGGEHPQSVLKNYAGLVDLVHLKGTTGLATCPKRPST